MKSFFLMDGAGKAMPRNEKLLYYLTVALFISFYLPDMPVIGNIVIGAIFLLSFFYNSRAEKGRLLKERKEISLMLLFFLFHIISACISVNRQEGLDMLVLRLPLLIFPLSIGLIGVRTALKDRILISYCILTVLMSLFCLLHGLYRYSRSWDAVFLYDDSLTEVIARQSIYIALGVNLALFSFVYLRRKYGSVMKYAWLDYASIALLLFFHFLLASRIGIITLYSAMVIYAVYRIVKMNKLVEGVSIILGLAIGVFLLVSFFPKTVNRFRELQYPGYNYSSHGMESHFNAPVRADQWNGANIRLAVWKCGWELAGQHWLTGVPLGDKQDKLVEVFKSRHFDLAANSRRNMHNNYLDILCTFGVIGLGVFLLGYLVFPLLACYRFRDALGLVFILTFAAAMITENYMDGSYGCILLGYFLSFLASYKYNMADNQ